ncbi:protein translocase subunit SecF [Silvanigrella paludirubra]|jgi:preprotein translocase subunit SecF|uniref:Protein-export membrane protein SecF n=1 Tax=Silvanigrella paludirubra TaxID=2499159 RepID=A0A6N6VUD0_9BACT|nr:protein translocase subunit SecF [Silvanigrella paludirubra]KAB8039464.1 protein translocase subunit SecF [Silvanigrella paludirubra]
MAFKIGNIQVFPHNYYFDFMKWRKVTVGISILLVVASLLIIGIKGLNYSIDFLGGAEIQVNILNKSLTREQIKEAVNKEGFAHAEVTAYGNLGSRKDNTEAYIIRIQREKGQDENATTTRADTLVNNLKSQFGAEKIQIASVTNISGKVGKEDEYKGYMALLLSCIGILIYIAFRFDARFSPGAVLCLIHNVIIALGFMTLLGRPFTTTSIAAFLTIVGYSINDTVIVYDRIRETRLYQPKMPMIEVVNRSISQTMNRTILTSTTGILALLVLSIMGGGSIEDFAITMLVGVIVGTYSSIYVAAPLTLMMDSYFNKLGWKQKDNAEKAVVEKPKDFAPPINVRKKIPQEKK